MSHENLVTTSVEMPEHLVPLGDLGISVNPEERAIQLAEIDGEGILAQVTRIHEIVAPDNSHELTNVAWHIQSPDGLNRKKLAEPEERGPIFDHAANLVAKLEQARTGNHDTEPFLRRSGNILALSVVLAHGFEEGNGRTARTLGELVRNGFDPAQKESVDNLTLASQNRPEVGIRILSYLPTKSGIDITPNELLDRAAALDIPLAQDEAYQQQKGQYFTTPYPD